MNSVLSSIETQLPYYLSKDRKEGLLKALKDFPDNMDYYLDKNSSLNSEILQGDGLNSLKIIQYETLATKSIRGILLSNSCDLDSNNSRDRGLKAVIAPIIKLSKYKLILERIGVTEDKILAKMANIKAQKVTDIFYLPPVNSCDEEHIVILDDLHSIPLKFLSLETQNEKIFTLSQAGFYLFLLKISVHFCRFHENIER